jgi:hypothetical protein
MSPKGESWAARLGTTSLDPLEVLEFQAAIRAHKKTVKVGGREFTLTYKNGNIVHYRPAAEGIYVPSGYLDVRRFLED